MTEKYDKATVMAILRDYHHGMADIRDDGVWPSDACKDGDVAGDSLWNYTVDLDGPGTPNPLIAPSLPIPFTANQFAAFMLDGIGAIVPANYRDWNDGPDEGMLRRMGVLATKAKAAMSAAYSAILDAEAVVGKYPKDMELEAHRLADELDQSNGAANSNERVFEPGLSPTESSARRARARKAIEPLEKACAEAHQRWRLAFSRWRKVMVNHLLPSPYRRLLRALLLDEGRVKVEIENLQRIPATSITEIDCKKQMLAALFAELAQIHARLDTVDTGGGVDARHAAQISIDIEKMIESRGGDTKPRADRDSSYVDLLVQRDDEVKKVVEGIDAQNTSRTIEIAAVPDATDGLESDPTAIPNLKAAIQKELTIRNTRAANARYEKDSNGKQAIKAWVKECWKAWKQRPSSYKSATEFAKDMLDKQPEKLTNIAVVTRWVRIWEREER